MKDETVYLKLMLDAFRKLKGFTQGMDMAGFLKDEKTQSAVIMQLEVLGQFAKKVGKQTRDQVSIPWKEIAGTRDWIAHDYFNLKLEQVWETATKAVPETEKEVRKHLERAALK